MSQVQYLHTDQSRQEERRIWSAVRAILETDNYKHKISGAKSKSHWNTFQKLLHWVTIGLKTVNLYERGYNNIFKLELNKYRVTSPKIPKSFNGYSVLHLTDLHLDFVPELEQVISKMTKEISCDVCFITGDMRKDCTGGFRFIFRPLKNILTNIQATDGVYATLGNHDTYLMETMDGNIDIKFLINETIKITRGDDSIAITGTDDPFRYFTDQQIFALEQPVCEYKIALVHTSELSSVAARNQYDLYLCGHTHGGQICLPNGKPIISHQKEGKQFVQGLWNIDKMYGYTNKGCGVSGIAVRYNCPGEIAIFELYHGNEHTIQKVEHI